MSTLVAEPAGEAPPAAPKVSPAKGWYWASAALIVASLLAAGAIWFFGKRSVENQVGAFARFVAPNTADLRFKRAGQYLVYYEYRSTIDGQQVQAAPSPPAGIVLDLKDESGQSLELRRIGREYRYDVGDFQGVSVRRVNIPRQGLYHMTASAPGNEAFVVALGRGSTPSTDASQQTALLVGIIGSALGVIGLVTVGVLRSRSRAGLRAGSRPSGPAPVASAAAGVAAGVAAGPGEPVVAGPPAFEPSPPPAPLGAPVGPAVAGVPPPPAAGSASPPPPGLPSLPEAPAGATAQGGGPSPAGAPVPPPPPSAPPSSQGPASPPPATPAGGLPAIDRPPGGGWNPPVGEPVEPGAEEPDAPDTSGGPASSLPPPPPPPPPPA